MPIDDSQYSYIAGYEVLAVLGRGGMGTVYRVKGPDGQSVALKLLSCVTDGDPLARLRFQREFRLLSLLSHPNLVRVLDPGEHDGRPFYTMELVPGPTLKNLQPDPGQLIRYSVELCRALEYIHRAGVVHRDLKPDNVMVTDDGIKLMDFGLARDLHSATALSATDTIVGTVSYMAPEQFSGTSVDARADLYALGVMMYELGSGSVPFARPDWIETIQEILTKVPPPPSGVSPELEALIMRLIDKDPAQRFQTAGQVLSALETLAESGAVALPGRPQVRPVQRVQLLAAPLIGRDEASHRLLDLLQAVEGGQTRVAVMTAPSGMGKSRLATDIVRHVRRRGVQVFHEPLAAACDGYQVLLPLFRWLAGGADLGDHPLAALVANREASPVDKFTCFESFCQWVRKRAAQPTLIVLDALDNVDSDSMEMLRYLAHDLTHGRPVPLLLLCLQQTSVMGSIEGCEAVPLRPLTFEEVGELAGTVMGSPASPPAWLQDLDDHCGGNPGQVLKLLRWLIDEEALVAADSVWRLIKPDALARDPQTLLRRRLSRLSPTALEILWILALLGREATFARLQACVTCEEATLLTAMDALLEARLVEEHSQRSITMDEAVAAEVLAGLNDARRQSLHRDIAVGLERREPETAFLIGWHFHQGGLPSHALTYLRQALETATAQRAYRRAAEIASAMQHLEHLHDLSDDDRLRMVDALLLGDRGEDAETVSRRWLLEEPDPYRQACLLRRVGRACQLIGRHQDAYRAFVRALELLKTPIEMSPFDSAVALGGLLGRNGVTLLRAFAGLRLPAERRPPHPVRWAEEALQIALTLPQTLEFLTEPPATRTFRIFQLRLLDLWRQASSPETLAQAYVGVIMMSGAANLRTASRVRQRGSELLHLIPNAPQTGLLSVVLGMSAFFQARGREATRLVEHGLAHAVEMDQVRDEILLGLVLAAIELFRGRWARVRTLCERGVGKAMAVGNSAHAEWYSIMLSIASAVRPPLKDEEVRGGTACFLHGLAAFLDGDAQGAHRFLQLYVNFHRGRAVHQWWRGWDHALLALCSEDAAVREQASRRVWMAGMRDLVRARRQSDRAGPLRQRAAAWFHERGWSLWEVVARAGDHPLSLAYVAHELASLEG